MKINNGGCITTDTCNAAQKTRRILVGVINDTGGIVFEQDCYHNIRCVHTNGMAKSVHGYMGEVLEESLKNIYPHLCVTPNLNQVIRAYHKEFSLTATYPKGHGELFRDGIVENYPDEFLLHAKRATGS